MTSVKYILFIRYFIFFIFIIISPVRALNDIIGPVVVVITGAALKWQNIKILKYQF